jgi:Polyketide cyclase / dehydrase and lipid transport
MIQASATITTGASPQTVLEFVTDLERYRQADQKIRKIVDHGNRADLLQDKTTTVRYRGNVRGLVSPMDSNEVTLKRWSRVDFVGSPSSWVRRMVDFHGSFTCEPTDTGTVVTHVERFEFRRPFRWLTDPYLRDWLRRDVTAEMDRVGQLLS